MSKRKNRNSKGKGIHNMGLSKNELEDVLKEIAMGADKKQIANQYKISIGNVFKLCNTYQARIKEIQRELEPKDDLKSESVEDIAKSIIQTDDMPEEEPDNIPKEETNNMPIQVEKQERKFNSANPIPPEMVNSILSDLSENVMSQSDIAKMYGVSQSSVSRIKRMNAIKVIPHDTSINVPVDTPVVKTDELMALPVGIENYDPQIQSTVNDGTRFYELLVKENEIYDIILSKRNKVFSYKRLGMIADRHNMPTSAYVYDRVDQDLMFNYELQYNIAKEKILQEVEFIDGEPQNGILLYVTGLTCALASIINVCKDLNVPLTLMHYNNSEHCYMPQIITGGVNNVCPTELEFINRRNMFTYGCTAQEFIENHGGYEIIEVFAVNGAGSKIAVYNSTRDDAYRDMTLFIDKSLAWQVYIALVEHCQKDKNIYFNSVEVNCGKYYRTSAISKHMSV